MRFSEQWLRSWVNTPLSSKELVETFTMAGLEVDAIEPVSPGSSDNCIDIDLTPNRGDCLSILGLARELSAITDVPLKPHAIEAIQPHTQQIFPVQIQAKEACLRYVGRVIQGVNARAKTPDWMLERLQCAGLQANSIIVDILNYVMIEIGQPLHAFDLDKLKVGISVRLSESNEKMVLLDGQSIELKSNTLLIADQAGPVAIAGVMGGLESSVTLETQNVFIESALFSQKQLAGQARRYGLVTDASSRFERGVDPNLQANAAERVTALIIELCGGKVGPISEKKSVDTTGIEIELRYRQVERILGIKFSEHEIENFLTRLNTTFQKEDGGWKVCPPTYRYDLREEIDLVEECGRLHGYNLIPVTRPKGAFNSRTKSETEVALKRCKRLLVDAGYHEVITYSFVNPQLQSIFKFHNEALQLQNPISQDMSVMRQSLWPGLAAALQYNMQRQQTRLKVFESGLIFRVVEGELHQVPVLSGMVMGTAYPENWGYRNRPVDFFDIKGDVEKLCALTQGELITKAYRVEALHPGQSASLYLNGERMGLMGALHPEIEKELDLIGPIFAFEIELEHFRVGKLPHYERLSKFPVIRRDLAIVVDEALEVEKLLGLLRRSGGELLKTITLFDVYKGKGVPEGKKSLAMALILQANSRTLVDEEVDKLVKELIGSLQNHFSAELRV
ncbi:MAG: phenylalanine--tRNA ligase subunit beta [Gammaproteobacteria bacterium]